MSKIIDALKKAKGHRKTEQHSSSAAQTHIISLALNKEKLSPAQPIPGEDIEKRGASSKSPWLIGTVAAVCFLTLLVLNLALFSAFKKNSDINKKTANKLSRIEGLLNKSNQQLSALSGRIKTQEDDLAKLSRQTQGNQNDINLLSKNNRIQSTAIDNLTSAKNTLYHKIDGLYKEVDQLKVTLRNFKPNPEQ